MPTECWTNVVEIPYLELCQEVGLDPADGHPGRRTLEVFPVNLTRSGGSQGTPTTPATWTYSVVDPATGQTLMRDVNPTVPPHKWKRSSAGWMTVATFGFAHYNTQGQLVLGWINEVGQAGSEQQLTGRYDGHGGRFLREEIAQAVREEVAQYLSQCRSGSP